MGKTILTPASDNGKGMNTPNVKTYEGTNKAAKGGGSGGSGGGTMIHTPAPKKY